VLYYEYLGCLLFFSPFFTQPLRALGAILFMVMHIGFGSCLALGIFSPTSCTILLTLLPSWFWDGVVFPWLSRADRRITVLYYKDTPGAPLSTLITDFLMPPGSSIAVQCNDKLVDESFSWMAVERNGVVYTNFEAFEELCEVSPLLWAMRIVLRDTFFRSLYRRIFAKVSSLISLCHYVYISRAPETEKISTPEKNGRVVRKYVKNVMSALAIFLIGLCILWNCANLKSFAFTFPQSLVWVPIATRLDQTWNMFSPGPPKLNWWYTIEGVREDGKRMEIWRNGLQNWKATMEPFSIEKPLYLGDTVGNHRWVKYYEYLNWGPNGDEVRLSFGRYICREWNKRYHGQDRLWRFSLIFRSEENVLDGPAILLEPNTLWTHECYVRAN